MMLGLVNHLVDLLRQLRCNPGKVTPAVIRPSAEALIRTSSSSSHQQQQQPSAAAAISSSSRQQPSAWCILVGLVGGSSQADHLIRNTAMDDSIGGS